MTKPPRKVNTTPGERTTRRRAAMRRIDLLLDQEASAALDTLVKAYPYPVSATRVIVRAIKEAAKAAKKP